MNMNVIKGIPFISDLILLLQLNYKNRKHIL